MQQLASPNEILLVWGKGIVANRADCIYTTEEEECRVPATLVKIPTMVYKQDDEIMVSTIKYLESEIMY